MQHKARIVKGSMAIGLAGMLALGSVASVPLAAKDNAAAPALQVPVVGNTSAGGTFQGTAVITGFAVEGKNVIAIGTISGVVDNSQSFVSTFAAPVTLPSSPVGAQQAPAAAQGCQILNLVLGPLNLNVLGLVISIPNPIVLNITAVPGAGNLLGNLLCDVANLLNGGGALAQVANLLNQILGILNGL